MLSNKSMAGILGFKNEDSISEEALVTPIFSFKVEKSMEEDSNEDPF